MWSAALVRNEVGVKHQVQRAIQQLQCQLALGDHELALRAFQMQEDKTFDKHRIPSQLTKS